METSILTLMFVLWLAGLVTLPLWIYPLGRRSARLRRRLEAPHRHPRPAVTVLRQGALAAPRSTPTPPPSEPPAGAAIQPRPAPLAFSDGYAATAGAAPQGVDDVTRLLEERYATIAEVEETPETARPYRVTLVRGVSGVRVPGGAVCEYDRGVVAGLFSALVGMPVEVEESSCRARGGLYCAFHVRVDGPIEKPRAPRLVRARAFAARLLGRIEPQRRAPDRAAGAAYGAAQRSRSR